MEKTRARYETVGEALRRTLWLLVLPIAFVIASVYISLSAVPYHGGRSTLHDYNKKADLGLVTIVILPMRFSWATRSRRD